jgi:hypothetical protein
VITESAAFAQTNIQPRIAADTFYWKHYRHIAKPQKLDLNKFCVKNQKTCIDLFLRSNIRDFPQFTNDSISPYKIKDLRRCLSPVDLNGDGLSDMIFNGPGGGESDITQIYLNRKDSFELVFEDYQYISSMTVRDGHLLALIICDPGRRDDWLYFERNYRINSENMSLVFIHGKQTADYMFAEKPALQDPKPMNGVSAHDTLVLRASAEVVDEPINPHLESRGNQIALFSEKFRATVIGKKENKKGEIWLYIEIIPDIKPCKSIFYETDKFPTFIRGWVKFNDIKVNP